jgi:AcrR family transcriptional regulator
MSIVYYAPDGSDIGGAAQEGHMNAARDTSRGTSAGTPAGRPRNPEIEQRVRSAALRLLVDKGYAGLHIDDVAQASGVAKTTMYRRWPSLAMLVLDAVDNALGHRDFDPTGDTPADLELLLTGIYESLVGNPVGWALPAIGLDLLGSPDLAAEYRRRFVDPPRQLGIELIRRGVADGSFRTDIAPEAVVDAVVGSIIYRRVIGDPPPTLESLRQLTTRLLHPR